MLKLRNLANQHQKRLLRVLYGHTQATPYAATLHPSLRNTDGSFRAPLNTDALVTGIAARTAAAFLLQGGLVPGMVVQQGPGESVLVSNGVAGERNWGLLANFVGGTLDDVSDENNVGVWYGKDAVVEILAPAFDDSGLAALAAGINAAPGGLPMKAGADGRLVGENVAAPTVDTVGFLIDYRGPSRIVVKLNV